MTDRGTWSRGIEAKLDNAGLTQDGKDWLLMALDPFPDVEHTRVGIPDGQAGRSCVQQYNQLITIDAPPLLAAGALWDCHIAFIPELFDPVLNGKIVSAGTNTFPGTLVSDNSANLSILNPASGGPPTNAFPWRAPIMAVAVPSGTQTMPTAGSSTTNFFNSTSMSISGFDLTGYVGPQARLAGGGFEVENVTNELNISGGVSYYTIPTETVTSCTTVLDFTDGGTNIPTVRTIQVSRTPPPTLAQAMSIPGSLSRKAKDGAYVQFRCSKGQPNPPIEPMRQTRVFMAGSAIQASNSNMVGGFTAAPSGWNAVSTFTPTPNLPYSQAVPFDISGAYFNGLSASTALNVTLRLYIEVFPTASNQTLVSLTQPCPSDDPIAYELYSRVSRALPPGCEVRFNANGGWFKGLMNTISSVAPTIGGALGTVIPGAGIIGNGVGKLADMLGGMKFAEGVQKEVDERKKGFSKRAEGFQKQVGTYKAPKKSTNRTGQRARSRSREVVSRSNSSRPQSRGRSQERSKKGKAKVTIVED